MDTPRPPGPRRFRFTALACALGAGAGGAYAHLLGCNGTCPLTSSVFTASVLGGLVGLVAGWPARHDPVPATTGGEDHT